MKPYACHGRPRPVAGEQTHLAQDGYLEPLTLGHDAYTREALWVPVHHVFTTACQYDKSATDGRCAGCEHVTA